VHIRVPEYVAATIRPRRCLVTKTLPRIFVAIAVFFCLVSGRASLALTPPQQKNAEALPASEQRPKKDYAVALFTAGLTIAGIVLKDLVFKVLAERRADKRTQLAVYEYYSRPLAASAVSLASRMHEIFLQAHRPVYLKSSGLPVGTGPGSAFRAYKKLSTLYRLACVLGWIRACRREFSYLRIADTKNNQSIDRAITKFEEALANGSWVEQMRVIRLCNIWHLAESSFFSTNPKVLEDMGVEIDNAIYDKLEAVKLEDVEELDDSQKQALCGIICRIIAARLNTNAVSDKILEKTWPEAFSSIAMREAWIYRDWQSAIGDMMLDAIKGETRKFEVIGFGKFELLCRSTNQHEKSWISRLSDVFDNVDVSFQDRYDARPRQLKAVAEATAELVRALREAQGSRTIVSDRDLHLANQILKNCKSGPGLGV